MRALARALDAKDADTWQHSSRVAALSAAMARALQLDRRMQAELRLAGELHDVGKIGVPVELLRRPGRLSPAEYREILRHTVIGERLLRPLMRTHPHVLQAVRSHHERFAGGGFPDGLRGYAIPLAARIVAVADAFDAMTSSRPYRPALGVTAAVRELRATAGSQFDPACVRALLLVLRAEGRVGPRRARPPRRAVRPHEGLSCAAVPTAMLDWRGARRMSGPARADPARPAVSGLAREPPGPPRAACWRGGAPRSTLDPWLPTISSPSCDRPARPSPAAR